MLVLYERLTFQPACVFGGLNKGLKLCVCVILSRARAFAVGFSFREWHHRHQSYQHESDNDHSHVGQDYLLREDGPHAPLCNGSTGDSSESD